MKCLRRCLAALLPVALAVPGFAFAADSAGVPEDWNLKVQSTYIWQGQEAFQSPYAGAHSLLGAHASSYSFTATAALGLRLGQDTELYLDPEGVQGEPLSGLYGLAGFTNGEMTRGSGSTPKFYIARVFVRHTIGLSDDRDEVESDLNQLGGSQARRRLVLTAGKLSILDLFDNNSYSHDPRSQFMNWALMTNAAYDYAADARGYTWGGVAEYDDDDWALRAGRFIQAYLPNQQAIDPRIFEHYGDQIELERHYSLGEDEAGVARLLAYRNRAVMARYTDALALAEQADAAPDVNQVRDGDQIKYGVGLNLEQQLGKTLGVFARGMWADGKAETFAFTEADRSLSGGASINGAAWGRASDTLGLATAQSMLSPLHRDILAAGGLTVFLGDGQLNYRPERVFESYYSLTPIKGLAITFDGQHIVNPGYNHDRGPVNFVGVRVHVEN